MLPRRQMPTQLMRNGYTTQRTRFYSPRSTAQSMVMDPTAGLTPIGVNRFLTPEGDVVSMTERGLVSTTTGENYGVPRTTSEWYDQYMNDLPGVNEPRTTREWEQRYREEHGLPRRTPSGTDEALPRIRDVYDDQQRRVKPGVDAANALAAGLQQAGERQTTDDRLNRWWGAWISESAGFSGDFAANENYDLYQNFMETDVWGHPDDHVTSNWAAVPGGAILELAAAGGDIRGMLDRALRMSQENPDKFIRLQNALLEHGFLDPDAFTWGVWSQAEVTALAGILDAKYRWGPEKSLTEILSEASTAYWSRSELSDAALEALNGVDPEAADELTRLREQIENFEAQFTASSSDALEQIMQDEAINVLGRRLNDQEVDALVQDVHDRERADFYANDPQVLEYRRRVKQYEDAVTNQQENLEGVIKGTQASQVDLFLRAVAEMESKGSGGPNAYNPDSQAFGTFQFIPSTWIDVTRAASLDPNDKSEENQWAAARYHAADIFSRRGNWRDVFISWYAGEGALNYLPEVMLADQWGGEPHNSQRYPSIMAYADRGMQIMGELSSEVEPGNTDILPDSLPYAGMINWATSIASAVGDAVRAGEIDPNDESTWKLDKRRLKPGKIDSVSDFDPDGLDVHESERFDPYAYLRNSLADGFGPEADAWRYAMTASDFFDNLGRR